MGTSSSRNWLKLAGPVRLRLSPEKSESLIVALICITLNDARSSDSQNDGVVQLYARDWQARERDIFGLRLSMIDSGDDGLDMIGRWLTLGTSLARGPRILTRTG
jgi:hypothetical protein